MRQLANSSQRTSASTQTEQLDISDNDFNEFCNSMTSYNSNSNNNNNYGHYYAIPAELVASDQPIYDLPNCPEDGISSQTDLSLSFLDLSMTSDLDDEDDDIDFSSGDDYNERRTSRFRLNDVTSVIDEDDEEEDEEEDEVDENILLHDVGTGQFMLDLLGRIAPPTDSSSSNECTPTSSKGTGTSTSSSSSSSHGRFLEFDSDFKSGSSPHSEEATTEIEDQLPMRRLKKLKRQVPRMGTRLEMLPPRSTASILDNIFFPPPPPLTSPSLSPSPEFQALFQSVIPSRDSLSPTPTPYQQHVYQDLIFDYPEERVDNFNNNNNNNNNSSSSNNSSDAVRSEAFYHVLSPDHLQEQQNFSDIQRIKKQADTLKIKAEHRVTFDLMKSSDEDIYENDYEVKSLLKDFSPEVKLTQLPPPLPKRPAQVKFTPRVQNSSGESASASPIFLRHSNQITNQIATASDEHKEQLKLHKSSAHGNVSSGVPRERSCENPVRSKQESRKPKHSSSRIRSTNNPVGSDRKVVVIGEDGVDGGRGEIYGKLAEIMYTNRANLRHTIMLQQKLFQQQLQAGPSSRRPKSQLVPNSQNLDIAELAKQNPWNVLPRQNESVQSTDWVIRRRQDGTRYITRRNKHSKAKESKSSQREVDKNTIPKIVAMAPQTIMPIFRTRRNRDKPLVAASKEGNKHQQSTNTNPMVQVDSFAALQNVLQGKMQVQNHPMPPKQNHSVGKPLLSVTTI